LGGEEVIEIKGRPSEKEGYPQAHHCSDPAITMLQADKPVSIQKANEHLRRDDHWNSMDTAPLRRYPRA